MYKFSNNYFLRKCYFERDEVPTQSVMKKSMSPPLAHVCFKSLPPKLKVLAGLEPPLKGGGINWYQSPEEQVAGRQVLLPLDQEHLNKLMSIDTFLKLGEKMKTKYHRKLFEKKQRALHQSDVNWRQRITDSIKESYDEQSDLAMERNTELFLDCIHQFERVWKESIVSIEKMLIDASFAEIKGIREEVTQNMKELYAKLLKQQSTTLYDEYEAKLVNEKARLKAEFISKVAIIRTDMGNKIHAINSEKHLTIERLRQLLESQNIACQVYVALKEREECEKELKSSNRAYARKIKDLKHEIDIKDHQINKAIDHRQQRVQFEREWKKKVCCVAKQFQMFVDYCLRALPQYADFFMNLEKLVIIHLGEVLERPSVESIIEYEPPEPNPHPLYLFCDKGRKSDAQKTIHSDLCPKHKTSSASIFPVIVINKKCIYSTCDNFEMFTDKVSQYVLGNRGDDVDLLDDHDYELDVPVKLTTPIQLQEIKLESSLMQILENEQPNLYSDNNNICKVCKMRYCFCSFSASSAPQAPDADSRNKQKGRKGVSAKTDTETCFIGTEQSNKSKGEWECPDRRRCTLSRLVLKQLDVLPIYMKKFSPYETPILPNYEPCSLEYLKNIVRNSKRKPEQQASAEIFTGKIDVCTEYSDQHYEYLCTCFDDKQLDRISKAIRKGSKISLIADCWDDSYMQQSTSSFLTDRRKSLQNLCQSDPKLQEIFQQDCDFGSGF